jgi:hypothetical protein
MALIRVLRGKASRLTQVATVSGGSQWAHAVNKSSFLVDNRPTTFSGTCHLRDGDDVTVAGVELRGEFRAYAIRNESTGVEYFAPRVGSTAGAVLLLALLILFPGYALTRISHFGMLAGPLLLIGVMILIAFGLVLAIAKRNHQANQALIAARDALASPGATAPSASRSVVSEARSFPRAIAGAIVGTFGVGLLGMATLLSLLVFHDLFTVHELGRGSAIFALLICLATGIGGYTLARWGFGKRKSLAELPAVPPQVSSDVLKRVRTRVLAVANEHGGRVTAAELAAELAIEKAPAQRVLEEAAEAGDARLLFTPEGDPVYEFQGLVTRKAEAKEPWEL